MRPFLTTTTELRVTAPFATSTTFTLVNTTTRGGLPGCGGCCATARTAKEWIAKRTRLRQGAAGMLFIARARLPGVGGSAACDRRRETTRGKSLRPARAVERQ